MASSFLKLLFVISLVLKSPLIHLKYQVFALDQAMCLIPIGLGTIIIIF